VKNVTQSTLLTSIERFYDAVPRAGAATEQFGGLTLFVRQGDGWPYYARPALDGTPPTADDVRQARARQRELSVPEAFEWVDEVAPGLAAAATEAGLAVHRHPLMVLNSFAPVAAPAGSTLRLIDPDSDDLAADLATIRAIAVVGFSSPGTRVGQAGPDDRDALLEEPTDATLAADRATLRSGRTARMLLLDGREAVCSGSYQRAGDVVEIVGVATLPSARRRGLGAALTSALTRHALDQGAALVLLSAGDDDVARMYGRIGFQRVGTACIAEPPT
jgi:ribosomal protein S18 acetylase RimI-like enzyme